MYLSLNKVYKDGHNHCRGDYVKHTKVYVILGLTVCVTSLILLIGGFMLWEDVLNFNIPVVEEDTKEVIIALPDATKEVVSTEEKMILPFTVNATKASMYFDKSLSDEQLEKAVIEYDGIYRPNMGNVYTYQGNAFEAVAVKSGVVQTVYEDPLMGNTVVLKCNDVDIFYQGLSTVVVNKGQAITIGDVIGVAGESAYYKQFGVHVFVSAKINNQYVNLEDLVK